MTNVLLSLFAVPFFTKSEVIPLYSCRTDSPQPQPQPQRYFEGVSPCECREQHWLKSRQSEKLEERTQPETFIDQTNISLYVEREILLLNLYKLMSWVGIGWKSLDEPLLRAPTVLINHFFEVFRAQLIKLTIDDRCCWASCWASCKDKFAKLENMKMNKTLQAYFVALHYFHKSMKGERKWKCSPWKGKCCKLSCPPMLERSWKLFSFRDRQV